MTYQLDHVTIRRQGKVVIDDLSLTLARGRLIGLIGPNGAGKSTLLAALAGDLEIDQGQISLDEQSLTRLSPERLAWRRAIMAQQTAAIFNLSVAQVLELGLYAFTHWPHQDRVALLSAVAKQTEVGGWLAQSITKLSIGQQQRVHFARAFLQAKAAQIEHGKAWLLLDEPTASQDPWQQQMMMSVCCNFATNSDVGVLLVMHDLTLAAQWCDEIIVLKDQALLVHGDSREVLTPEVLKRTYGNELDVQVLWEPVPGVMMSGRKRV
ncbi:MAG: ATP-binding cassette domain-containing protein [Burkholderiaceae bacterium]|nr:ATP-binding cassette domain-containing protein [Burkholderiaceae bacterium]